MIVDQKGVPEPQAALDKIKIIENNDPLVDLRTIPGITFRNEPNHRVIPFLRSRPAQMLAEASVLIPAPYHLHVISALRDFDHQKRIWQSHYDRLTKEHPEWPLHTVRRMINKYAAPVDHPAPPGHTTGAAVDVVLQKEDGSFVDLVPPEEMTDWSLGHTFTYKVDPAVRETRMMLLEAMLSVGFTNCRDEYWHYSWGDSGWAVRAGQKECVYGVILPPTS